MSHSARDTALKVLIACRTHGAWADAALKAQLARDQLSPQDAALCSRMVYGVTQNRLLLDFYLAAYCSQKPDHLSRPPSSLLPRPSNTAPISPACPCGPLRSRIYRSKVCSLISRSKSGFF